MNPWPEREVFVANLGAWALRGVFCALPSFVWAFFGQIYRPLQLVEMMAGIVTYIVGFAWVTSLPIYVARVQPGNLGWSLRVAANTRAWLAPLMVFGPDLCLGILASKITESWALVFFKFAVPKGAVGLIYATTLVQGALVSATMFLLALLIWGARVFFRKGGSETRPTFQGTS